VIFDREGCGRASIRQDIEDEVRARVAGAGWDGRADVVVLDPELEIWAFSPSPHLEHCLGWPRNRGRVRHWLERHDQWPQDQPKPGAPRDALERILREVRRPRSSTLYQCLGSRVSLRHCTDLAFGKFLNCLREWFQDPEPP